MKDTMRVNDVEAISWHGFGTCVVARRRNIAWNKVMEHMERISLMPKRSGVVVLILFLPFLWLGVQEHESKHNRASGQGFRGGGVYAWRCDAI